MQIPCLYAKLCPLKDLRNDQWQKHLQGGLGVETLSMENFVYLMKNLDKNVQTA